MMQVVYIRVTRPGGKKVLVPVSPYAMPSIMEGEQKTSSGPVLAVQIIMPHGAAIPVTNSSEEIVQMIEQAVGMKIKVFGMVDGKPENIW